MKIRESCLQSGTFIYKPGISVTKQDFHLQMGSLGLQMGFSGYYLPTYYTFEEAKSALFEYIESFYNRKRRHSALDYKTPQQVEDEALAA